MCFLLNAFIYACSFMTTWLGSLNVFLLCLLLFVFFFFQAEDGIRDWSVTGVQTCALPIFRRPDRYDDTFIFERKPFTWPGGKTLALWVIPNVEVWQFDSPAGAAISPNPSNRVPDVINYAWRDYGMRVGLWRIADVLGEAGIRATVALNA